MSWDSNYREFRILHGRGFPFQAFFRRLEGRCEPKQLPVSSHCPNLAMCERGTVADALDSVFDVTHRGSTRHEVRVQRVDVPTLRSRQTSGRNALAQ